MLETALTEAEVLCEGVLIRPTLAGLLAVHEEGTHLPSADIQIQYAAGSAAIALGEYYMSIKEPEEVSSHNNNNNNNSQAFQLIVLARYLLGVPNPSPVSQHALT